jgi:hypothetical protein
MKCNFSLVNLKSLVHLHLYLLRDHSSEVVNVTCLYLNITRGLSREVLIDPDWIIILFFIYLNAFRVEIIGGINLQGHFNDMSQFGKLWFETL